MSYNDSMPGFSKLVARSMAEDGWNASDLHIYSHAGTHMDAPAHFDINPTTIDEIPPHRFISDCHIIKVPDSTESQILGLDVLGEKANRIKEMESVIFQTGWSKYYKNKTVYRNKLPRIGAELASWLAKRRVNLVGVEPPSVADVNNLEEIQLIHRILLEANILILEGITNLEAIQKEYVKLLAFPLKIYQGDGAPVRALIIEE